MNKVSVLVFAAILALASGQFQQNTFAPYPGSGYSGYTGSVGYPAGYPGGYQVQQYGMFPVNSGAYYPMSSGSLYQGYAQPMQGGYWLGNSHPIVKQSSFVPFNGDYWSGQAVQVHHHPVPYPVPAPVPIPFPAAQSAGMFGLDVRGGSSLVGLVLAGVVAGLVAKNG